MGSLVNNKMRAILTMLGVIIGVAAVIALLSVGNGVRNTIEGEIQSIGSNLVVVMTDMETSGGYQALSARDAAAIADPLNVPAVRTVAAEVQGSQQVLYGGEEARVTVSGVTAEYLTVRNLDVALGSPFAQEDVDTKARVAILGANVAEDLFPANELPIGQSIKIAGVKYEVIGLLKEVGGMGMASQDDQVFIPLSTAQARLYTDRTRSGDRAVSVIYAQAADESQVDQAVKQIEDMLRERHDVAYQADDDFSIINQADILDMANVVTSTITLFLGAIAGISLLVGGIGIMNIMLVSVTERTREIGIRKAIGALRRDILTQFLIESLVISLVGGSLGIVLGVLLSSVIGSLSIDLTPAVEATSVLMSFGFAAAVGLIFGIYPAWRAASLRPIEALRYE
jgi:putative ABC transport system permease protein